MEKIIFLSLQNWELSFIEILKTFPRSVRKTCSAKSPSEENLNFSGEKFLFFDEGHFSPSGADKQISFYEGGILAS
jgi:hypothetical protein